MPFMCCVPNCKGNYRNGPKVTVFNFPNEDSEKTKWINAIKRQDFAPSKNSKVCELHFRSCDIQRETSAFDEKTGTTITVPLKFPRLVPGTLPSQMPNCPKYMSSSASSRLSPESKKRKIEESDLKTALLESIKENEQYESARNIHSLSEVLDKKNFLNLSDFWTHISLENCIIFLHIIDLPIPKIKYSVVINAELLLSVNIESTPIPKLENLKLPLLLDSVNVLNNVLDSVKSLDNCETSNLKTQTALIVVEDALKVIFCDMPDSDTMFKFIYEQIQVTLMKKHRIRYSTDLLIFASLISYMAPHVYRFLRDSGNFILPYPSTIKRICFSKADPHLEQSDNFLMYVRQKFNALNNVDKFVVLMIDEIHLKSVFDFKGGNIVGSSRDGVAAATSAHVFMISSISSKYKDVVHILPVKSIVAETLFDYILKTIVGLEKIGFRVIAVIADNNSINRKAISMFSNPNKVQIVYCHPVDKTRPLFYLADSVHLLKCIRNNWVNQKYPERSMFYPNFEGITNKKSKSHFSTASLTVLETIHQYERNFFLKFGYNLSYRALHPTSIEKQSVSIALQIFNELLAHGVSEFCKSVKLQHGESTANFIEIINTWWKIMNVKTPFKGIHKNDEYLTPLTHLETDKKIIFLNKFLYLLEAWESMNCTNGSLTKETHSALKITTYGMVQIALYCHDELKMSFILPGKFQTDNLEARFSKYRQFSGAQYHVSLRQIFEVEKKLRTQSLLQLGFVNKSFDNLYEQSALEFTENDADDPDNIPLEVPFSISISDIDFLNINEQLPVITYLSGYCVHNLLKKLKCDLCSASLVLSKHCELPENQSYIKSLDRGKLLYPQKNVIDAVMLNYIVINKLCSEFELKFFKCKNQRLVAFQITFELLLSREMIDAQDFCENGHCVESLFKSIVWSASNTILNNLCKSKNDSLNIEAKEKSKLNAQKKKLKKAEEEKTLKIVTGIYNLNDTEAENLTSNHISDIKIKSQKSKEEGLKVNRGDKKQTADEKSEKARKLKTFKN